MNQETLKQKIVEITKKFAESIDEHYPIMGDEGFANQILSIFESYQAEKYKKIEEAVEFFDPKNKEIPYVKLDKVLSILKKVE